MAKVLIEEYELRNLYVGANSGLKARMEVRIIPTLKLEAWPQHPRNDHAD
jgi:hypothetical protein